MSSEHSPRKSCAAAVTRDERGRAVVYLALDLVEVLDHLDLVTVAVVDVLCDLPMPHGQHNNGHRVWCVAHMQWHT